MRQTFSWHWNWNVFWKCHTRLASSNPHDDINHLKLWMIGAQFWMWGMLLIFSLSIKSLLIYHEHLWAHVCRRWHTALFSLSVLCFLVMLVGWHLCVSDEACASPHPHRHRLDPSCNHSTWHAAVWAHSFHTWYGLQHCSMEMYARTSFLGGSGIDSLLPDFKTALTLW